MPNSEMIMNFPVLFNYRQHCESLCDVGNEISVVQSILQIFLAAELATQKDAESPWLIENNLNKRRGFYTFDRHLQQMLLYVKNIAGYNAKCIECGNKSLYKTEWKNSEGYCLHFNHSFDPCAKYNRKYLVENTNHKKPKFAYFRYELNELKNTIISLKFVIPSDNKKNGVLKEIDLSAELDNMRKLFAENNNLSPGHILDEIKNGVALPSKGTNYVTL